MSNTIKVERRPQRGRCMIAAKNLEPGDLIFEIPPLCSVVDESHVRDRCASCFVAIRNDSAPRGRRCSGCKSIRYCSRDCQTTDWTQHRSECKAWTKVTPDRVPPRSVRMVGRILRFMNSEEDGGKPAQLVREAVGALVDHNHLRTPDQREKMMLSAMYVAKLCVAGYGKRALSWPSTGGRDLSGLVDNAFALFGKIACNVFSIVSDLAGGSELGAGMYLQAVTANHSCIPNAVQSFDGNTLSFRCTSAIQEGEEITIPVTSVHRPRSLRRQFLREHYFFDCQCTRCGDSESASSDEDAFLEGYTCPTGGCRGVCVKALIPEGRRNSHSSDVLKKTHEASSTFENRLDNRDGRENTLNCTHCGASRPVKESERERQVILGLLERGRACSLAGEGTTAKEGLEEAMQRAFRFLHRGNWILYELFMELSGTCMEMLDFETAATHSCHGTKTHRACLAPFLPYFAPFANHLATASKLLLYIRQQPSEALALAEESLSILQVTHGEKNPLYMEVAQLVVRAQGSS